MPDPVLNVGELCFAFPSAPNPLIEGLTFVLDAGQLLLIAGSVGSGKTTLARLLAGELAPNTGRVERAGDVFWTPMGGVGLPPTSTLAELAAAIDSGATADPSERVPPLERVRSVELAGELGVRDLNRPIAQLSYGNRQKVLVALAFGSGDHRLVILDEPFAGVDQASLRPMVNVIERARRDGTAVVLINSVEVTGVTPDLTVDLSN